MDENHFNIIFLLLETFIAIKKPQCLLSFSDPLVKIVQKFNNNYHLFSIIVYSINWNANNDDILLNKNTIRLNETISLK